MRQPRLSAREKVDSETATAASARNGDRASIGPLRKGTPDDTGSEAPSGRALGAASVDGCAQSEAEVWAGQRVQGHRK